MNGLYDKYFSVELVLQNIGCQCYLKHGQKQLERKFFSFHRLACKKRFTNFTKVAGFIPCNYV